MGFRREVGGVLKVYKNMQWSLVKLGNLSQNDAKSEQYLSLKGNIKELQQTSCT